MSRSIWIAAAILLASMGMVRSADAALIGATATFLETTPTNSNPTADATGGTDQWSFSVNAGIAPGFYISSLTWTLPADPAGAGTVIYDTVTGGPGIGVGYDFDHVSGVVPLNWIVADGGKTLTINFNPNTFLAGSSIDFTIDVDDVNGAVRGWYPPGNGAIGGSNTNPIPANDAERARRAKLDITYFDGTSLTSVSTYYYGTGSNSAGTAEASASLLLAAPEPTTWAMWTLGLAGLVVAERRRRRS